MLLPELDRLAPQYEGRVKFVKCDSDENHEVAARYGVTTIPNLLFFQNGEVAGQSIGFVNGRLLADRIEAALGEPVPAVK